MTPTLIGRWQTRLFLFEVVGIPITAGFALLYGSLTPFALLLYVLFLGIGGWDVFYTGLQRRRWDRDWPPLFAWLAGLGEGVFLWGLISLLVARGMGLPGVAAGLTFGRFALHYLTVFGLSWVASHSLLPILFPRWRFRGGQWLS